MSELRDPNDQRHQQQKEEQEREQEEEQDRRKDEEEENQENKKKFLITLSLELTKRSSLENKEDLNYECKTPKANSPDRKNDRAVEMVKRCPLAPRKQKTLPLKKRRVSWLKGPVVLLDVSKEVESLFPRAVLEDFGKKIKKARV